MKLSQMKLSPLHLLLVLLLGLFVCSLLNTHNVFEGLENKKDVDKRAPQEARDRVLFDDHPLTANPLALDEGRNAPPQEKIVGDKYGDPLGIPRSQIPSGDEDLYILKSEVVPPVCPACPSSAVCPRQEPPPPCPPCARCPEPAFECKKVPNYRNNDDMYLPRPVLADFSQFGM